MFAILGKKVSKNGNEYTNRVKESFAIEDVVNISAVIEQHITEIGEHEAKVFIEVPAV